MTTGAEQFSNSSMTGEQFMHRQELEVVHNNPIAIAAIRDAFSRLSSSHTREAEGRIINGISNRFSPADQESRIITEQLRSGEYDEYVQEITDYLEGAKVGAVLCPDGRINPYYAIGDPGVVVFHQRLAGIPETRPSTSEEGSVYVLNDPNIMGSMVSSMRKRKARFPKTELVELPGPHINSRTPVKGCGAEGIIISRNQLLQFGMRHGGIDRYYKDLGNGFFAFNTFAEKVLQVRATTFDLTHDLFSQGLIVGLRDAHQSFDPRRSLLENLTDLHGQRRIVMTEKLDPLFADQIRSVDKSMYPDHSRIDMQDSQAIANNIMRIGRIAKTITQEEEKKGFRFIPENITRDATPIAKRVLAYTLIRNIVARRLAELEPGIHPLMEHNEEWLRIGSEGPTNIDKVSFVLRTPSGSLRPDDIDAAFNLVGILRGALALKEVKPEDEAVIVVVGDTHDPSMYASPEIAEERKDILYSTVGNNAALLRNARRDDIENGAIVVIGALFGPDKTITEIVR